MNVTPAIEICTLGTASGLPTAQRFAQTIVLTQEDRHVILDAGDGASSLLARNGFDHRRISAIFISHMHGDHHAGLIQVIKTCRHLRRSEELLILAPAEGIPAFKAYLEASYLFDEWLDFPIRWLPLPTVTREAFHLPGGATLRAYPNSHLADLPRRIAATPRLSGRTFAPESYSAVYEYAGCRIVYAGNLAGPQGSDEMAPFVEPCDTLIAELAHVEPVELGRFLAGRAIRRTVVVHFNPRWDAVPDEEILALIRNGAGETGLGGEIALARDGDRFACAPAAL